MKPQCLRIPAILSLLWMPVIGCNAPDRDEADGIYLDDERLVLL